MALIVFAFACLTLVIAAYYLNRVRKTAAVQIKFSEEVRKIATAIKKSTTLEMCKNRDVEIDILHQRYRHFMDDDFFKQSILHLTMLNDKKQRTFHILKQK